MLHKLWFIWISEAYQLFTVSSTIDSNITFDRAVNFVTLIWRQPLPRSKQLEWKHTHIFVITVKPHHAKSLQISNRHSGKSQPNFQGLRDNLLNSEHINFVREEFCFSRPFVIRTASKSFRIIINVSWELFLLLTRLLLPMTKDSKL